MGAAKSLDELMQSPEKFGMPTFDQFRRNKDKYVGRQDEEIAAVDAGDPILGARHKYYIETDARYSIDSIENAERIALDEGLSLFHDFVVDPQLREDVSGRIVNEVTFRKKSTLEKRNRW